MADEPRTPTVTEEDFTVGDWLVEPSLDRLSRGDTVLHLRPQLTDLLVLLAHHAGRTVPKHVILDGVWATQYVGESALTRCVAEIRRALGDNARQPVLLETIPKRGYRLVAPVVFLGAPGQPSNGGNGHESGGTLAASGFREAAQRVGTSAEHAQDADSAPSRTTEASPRGSSHREGWKLALVLIAVVLVTAAAGRCGSSQAPPQRDVPRRTEAPATGRHVTDFPDLPSSIRPERQGDNTARM